MRGKTKVSPHVAKGAVEAPNKSIVSLDNRFLGLKRGGTKSEQEKAEEQATNKGHSPSLVMHDSDTKGIFVYAAETKCADDSCAKQ